MSIFLPFTEIAIEADISWYTNMAVVFCFRLRIFSYILGGDDVIWLSKLKLLRTSLQAVQ